MFACGNRHGLGIVQFLYTNFFPQVDVNAVNKVFTDLKAMVCRLNLVIEKRDSTTFRLWE